MKGPSEINPLLPYRIEREVKMLLHASRDCMRTQGMDTTKIRFHAMDSYYAEAFGVMRGLVLMGCGYFGSSNLNAVVEGNSKDPKANLRWWFCELETEVLEEEHFGGDNICQHCLEKYGKTKPWPLIKELMKERE